MRFLSLFSILFFVLSGCSHNRSDIQLQKVTSTTNIMECNTIFSNNRKSIIELNEILIQIGTLDVLDDELPNAAIIHNDGKEIILRLKQSDTVDHHVNEVYAGNGYKLQLNYQVKYTDNGTKYNDPYYEGDCQIWHGTLYSKIDVYGLRNTLF